MRGFLQPAVQAEVSESQKAYRTLSRGRRTKVARAAQTTLVKADRWAGGNGVPSDLADALERAYKTVTTKKK